MTAITTECLLKRTMPVSKSRRANKSNRKSVRIVKSGASVKSPRRKSTNASVRKAPQRASVKSRATKQRGRVVVLGDVPEWSDLIKAKNQHLKTQSESRTFLGAVSTLRFTLVVLAIAGIFTLYVGHVYSTQDLLSEVQTERRENLSLRLQYNRTKGIYDAATGPAVIYERAHALGLEEKMLSGPPVRISGE